MPSSKRVIQPAPSENLHVVKPEPPEDLWQQLEEIERETLAIKPPGSFTVTEYADKRGLSRNKADHTLRRLEALGKVERHKIPGSVLLFYTIKK